MRLSSGQLGEEISGSDGSGSEEMDEGEDEAGETGGGRRRKRGKNLCKVIIVTKKNLLMQFSLL